MSSALLSRDREGLRKQLLDRLRGGNIGKTHLVVWPRGQGQVEEWFRSVPSELWRKKISHFHRKWRECLV